MSRALVSTLALLVAVAMVVVPPPGARAWWWSSSSDDAAADAGDVRTTAPREPCTLEGEMTVKLYRNEALADVRVPRCATYADLLEAARTEFIDRRIDQVWSRAGVLFADVDARVEPLYERDEHNDHLPFLIVKSAKEAFMYPAIEVGERVWPPAGDKVFNMTTVSTSPRIFWIENYNSVEECEEIMSYATSLPNWIESTVGDTYATRKRNSYRESRQVWVGPNGKNASPTTEAARHRALALTKMPATVFEDVQVVKYQPGGHYYGHPDASEIGPNQPYREDNMYFKAGGNRHLTILYYYKHPESGGETVFPFANGANREKDERAAVYRDGRGPKLCEAYDNVLRVAPKAGAAVLFYSLIEGHQMEGWLDPWSYHMGCDVREGEKWIGNQWIRNKRVWNEKTQKHHLYDNVW